MSTCLLMCLDNSEYLRNGDFVPTRYKAQQDAAISIADRYTRLDKSSIGILSMAGQRVEMRVNPIHHFGGIIGAILDIHIEGESDFLRGIQTAQLALKHRQEKEMTPRILCFVGSPITTSQASLVALGNNLRKNGIALDLISFGEVEKNHQKLSQLHAAVNLEDGGSFLLEAPTEDHPELTEVIKKLPIFAGNANDSDFGSEFGAQGDMMDNEYEVDPAVEPELFMAIRLSLAEERAMNQNAGNAALSEGVEGEGSGAANVTSTVVPADALADASSGIAGDIVEENFAESDPITVTPVEAAHDETSNAAATEPANAASSTEEQENTGNSEETDKPGSQENKVESAADEGGDKQ